jgi:phosphonate transport system substrate-binding protein
MEETILKIKHILAATAALSLLVVAAGCSSKTTHADKSSSKTLTVVFLPSESSKEMTPVRTALSKVLHKATGKKINVQTTTDYNVAIQALASGKAQLGLLGPDSYIEARKQNSAVNPLVTYSGESGTLKDAHYNSYVMVPKAKADSYKDGGSYSLKKVKGKKISFVSATSTSGFAVPAGAIAAANGVKKTDLQQGGGFFDKVLYGQSHPGSAVNLFNGDVDVAAFDDIDLVNYGKFTNDASKAGAIFKINDDAPAPLDKAKGKESVAISVAQVQNEPLAINDKTVSKADRAKIIKALTAQSTTDNPIFFSKPDAEKPGLFTQTGKVHFMAISDKWYAPTHEVLGK